MTALATRQAEPHYALPAGPHTSLYRRELSRRERERAFNAEYAKLTPANIAALEHAVVMLLAAGYPVELSL